MGVKVSNNAFGTLSAGISSSDTTVTLDSGQGSRFPTLGAGDYFYATLVDTSNNLEIVKATARSTDSMTVTRAQDNTTARAFAIGDRFELRPVAALFEAIQTESTPQSDSITTAMLQDDSVTNAKVAAGAVGGTEINSTFDISSKTVTLPAGHLRKIYHARNVSEVTTTSSSPQTTVSVTVPMDTDDYNYLIQFHTPVQKQTSGGENDGVNMYIRVGTTTVSTAYHRLFSANLNTYANQSIFDYITSGYSSGTNQTVSGAISVYSGGQVRTHDNSPDATSTGQRIIVWEFYK